MALKSFEKYVHKAKEGSTSLKGLKVSKRDEDK